MKILFVHHMPMVGGATVSLLGLVKFLKSKGHDVEVLFTRRKGNAFFLFDNAGISYRFVDGVQIYGHAYGAYNSFASRRPWSPIVNLIKVFTSVRTAEIAIQQSSPDIVYLNTSVLLSFSIAAKRLNKKVVWHLRERIHSGIFGFRKTLVRYLFRNNANLIISISKDNKKTLGIADAHVIYNSVDVNMYKELKSSIHLKGKEENLTFAFLGGSVPSKGAEVGIKAFLKLLNNYPDCQMVVAGKFERDNRRVMNTIERKVDELLVRSKSKGKIKFLGVLNQEEIAKLLINSNVLLWPANVPHFSRPIMEAMVLGIPTLASNFESTREIVKNGKTGLLVQPNTDGFYKGMLYCREHLNQLEQMGNAGQKFALENFNESKNLQKVMTLVEELMTR